MFNQEDPYKNIDVHTVDRQATIAHTIIRDTEPRQCIVPTLHLAFDQEIEMPEDKTEIINAVLSATPVAQAAAFFDIHEHDDAFAAWHAALTPVLESEPEPEPEQDQEEVSSTEPPPPPQES